VDSTLSRVNSVRDILWSIVRVFSLDDYEQVIMPRKLKYSHSYETIYEFGHKTYVGIAIDDLNFSEILKNGKFSFLKKCRLFFKKILYIVKIKIKKKNISFQPGGDAMIEKILRKEKPGVIVSFTYDPSRELNDFCNSKNIPYFDMRYDTRITAPDVNKEKMYIAEKYAMEHSQGYFVPSFFMDDYKKHFDSKKLIGYNLPLVINKETVKKALLHAEEKYKFSYFGQIQSFRYPEKMKDLFIKLKCKLDVFYTGRENWGELFNNHEALIGEELYQAVANSKFLVAFDNGHPYEHYLPSKAYLYVSFTKPIIVLGDNENSALKSFLKDYPNYYYQNINEPLDGLIDFIEDNGFSKSLNEELYNKYDAFTEDRGVPELRDCIKKVFG